MARYPTVILYLTPKQRRRNYKGWFLVADIIANLWMRFLVLCAAAILALFASHTYRVNVDYNMDGVSHATPASYAEPTAWAVCSWTGMRDSVIVPGEVALIRAENIVFFGSNRWVACRSRQRVGEFNYCLNWIVYRDGRAPGSINDTIYLRVTCAPW